MFADEAPDEHQEKCKCKDRHPHVPRLQEEPRRGCHGRRGQRQRDECGDRQPADSLGEHDAPTDRRDVQHVHCRRQRERVRPEQLVERIQQIRHARPRRRALVLDPRGHTDQRWMTWDRPDEELGVGEVAGEIPLGSSDGGKGDDDDHRRRHREHDRVPATPLEGNCHGSSATMIRATRSPPSGVSEPSAVRTGIVPSAVHDSHHWQGIDVATG